MPRGQRRTPVSAAEKATTSQQGGGTPATPGPPQDPPYCDRAGRSALPATPETVAMYLAVLAQKYRNTRKGASAKSYKQIVAAINHVHREFHLETPGGANLVKQVRRGIRAEQAEMLSDTPQRTYLPSRPLPDPGAGETTTNVSLLADCAGFCIRAFCASIHGKSGDRALRKGAATCAFALHVRYESICAYGGWSVASGVAHDYIDPLAASDARGAHFFGWLMPSVVPPGAPR
ncbi:hypothetical protein NFJ02_31g79070 [Pycnococcus provasolii]